MEQIPMAELERTMKVQEVILQAMAKKITWWQAAEILGISNRTMRRWKWKYENEGFKGLLDRRRGKPSWKRVPPGGNRKDFGALPRDVLRSERASLLREGDHSTRLDRSHNPGHERCRSA